jgi:hypothetical protein
VTCDRDIFVFFWPEMTVWLGSDRAKDRTRERPEFRVAWIETTDGKESNNERSPSPL